jgi:hypothetical protein
MSLRTEFVFVLLVLAGCGASRGASLPEFHECRVAPWKGRVISATVNGMTVKVGDVVLGAKVVSIETNGEMVLERNGRQFHMQCVVDHSA